MLVWRGNRQVELFVFNESTTHMSQVSEQLPLEGSRAEGPRRPVRFYTCCVCSGRKAIDLQAEKESEIKMRQDLPLMTNITSHTLMTNIMSHINVKYRNHLGVVSLA